MELAGTTQDYGASRSVATDSSRFRTYSDLPFFINSAGELPIEGIVFPSHFAAHRGVFVSTNFSIISALRLFFT